MIKKVPVVVNFGRYPTKSITPDMISIKISRIAKGSAKGIKNSIFSTSAEKYSSNLYCDPMGSTNFTKPENTKVAPTKNLEIRTKNFILNYL